MDGEQLTWLLLPLERKPVSDPISEIELEQSLAQSSLAAESNYWSAYLLHRFSTYDK